MQYIHYHNDFTVPISLVIDSATINPSIIGSITFYTRNNGNTYCCCWDCKTLYVDGNNVMAVLNSHNLETGVLNYMVEYQIPDSNYPDGFQKVCQHYTSDIELTTQNGDITVAEAQIIYGETIRELIESAGYSYTKSEVDEMIAGISAQVNTYTKPEIDSKLSLKANSADVYTKGEVDELIDGIDPDLPDNIVTDANYVHTDNNYTTREKSKLAGISTGAEVNVQSDWNVTDTSSDAYIKNKPTIPTVDSSITGSSQANPVKGGAIYTALQGKVGYEYYQDFADMERDNPANGSIGYDGENENFYIYDRANGVWKPIDQAGGEQSNWNETDTSSPAYIQNKPIIPTKTSDLTNDSNFIADASYVHTDNNYTTAEKSRLAEIDGKQRLYLKATKSGSKFTFKDGNNTLTLQQSIDVLNASDKDIVLEYNEDLYYPLQNKDDGYSYSWSFFSMSNSTIYFITLNYSYEEGFEDTYISASVTSKVLPSISSLGFGYITTSQTSTATAVKGTTTTGWELVKGAIITVKFTLDVGASATLDINGKGAKAIYYQGAAITAGVIKNGYLAILVYNGSRFELISTDH